MSFPTPERVRDRFRRSYGSYDEEAVVQKEVGDALVRALGSMDGLKVGRVLEIGSCTGQMTETLCRHYNISTLYLNDLVPELCSSAGVRALDYLADVRLMPGNIENLELPDKLDLVVSSSTFQWLEDLPAMFHRIAEALNDSGWLVFSMFGPGTYRQIKELIGVGLNYPEADEVRRALASEYDIIQVQQDKRQQVFGSPLAVLKHIQLTGVGGAGEYRWTQARLKAFDKEYRSKFMTEDGVSLDYCSLFVAARKK